MSRACDPVGAVEIADRLGVKRRTVDQWRQRDLGFPEPRWTVGGRPAWNWDDVTHGTKRARDATMRDTRARPVYLSSNVPAPGLVESHDSQGGSG